MLQHSDHIERIHVVYVSNGSITDYLLAEDTGINFDELIQIMGTVTYTRKLNTFRGGTGDAIMMTVVNKEKDGASNNYFVDIRELGIMISDGGEYKIHGNSEELVRKLIDWVKSQTLSTPMTTTDQKIQ